MLRLKLRKPGRWRWGGAALYIKTRESQCIQQQQKRINRCAVKAEGEREREREREREGERGSRGNV